MEPRKNSKADLESKRTVFLQIGFITALSAALLAFEWQTPDYGNIILPPVSGIEPVTDIIDVVIEKRMEPPKPINTTLLKEVENNKEEVKDILINSEIKPDEKTGSFEMPEILPEEPDEIQEPFILVEQMPVFPGGDAGLMQYLSNNIKYPSIARETGISGTVYIYFVIEPDGSVSSIRVLRGVSGGCSEEAVRVVSEMPAWTPGKQRSRPVRVSINLPVRFILRN